MSVGPVTKSIVLKVNVIDDYYRFYVGRIYLNQ